MAEYFSEFTGKEIDERLKWTPTAEDVGAVPNTRKINDKVLSSDISITAEDVGALPIYGGRLIGHLELDPQNLGRVNGAISPFRDENNSCIPVGAIADNGNEFRIQTGIANNGDVNACTINTFFHSVNPDVWIHMGQLIPSNLVAADTTPTYNGIINWTYG